MAKGIGGGGKSKANMPHHKNSKGGPSGSKSLSGTGQKSGRTGFPQRTGRGQNDVSGRTGFPQGQSPGRQY